MDKKALLSHGPLTLHPVGAHVTHWSSPVGEVFFLSSKTGAGVGTAIRGGVPLIGPWFGGILGKTPKHGLARINEWSVDPEARDTPHFRCTLVKDGYFFEFTAVASDCQLSLDLSVTNNTGENQNVQLAFHPYFLVEDITAIQISGLEGATNTDIVAGASVIQREKISFDLSPYDRIFTSGDSVTELGPARIESTARTITMHGRGHDAVVVWNPGTDGAKGMGDLGKGEESRFVCVEPALLGENFQGVPLANGHSAHLGMDVTIERKLI